MNFRRLKEMARKLGGVLVLDGEEPEFVILPYHQYEKIEGGEEVRLSTNSKGSNIHNGLAGSAGSLLAETNGMASSIADRYVSGEDEQESVERLNQEILSLKEEIRLKEEAELQSGELVESVANDQSTEPITETIDLG